VRQNRKSNAERQQDSKSINVAILSAIPAARDAVAYAAVLKVLG
jgi:hypothetical protein